MKLEFKGKIEHDSEGINLYHTHIKIPKKIQAHFQKQEIKRVIFTLNGGEENHGGFIPRGNGTNFLMTSKALLKKNKLNIGDNVLVTLWEDTSKYGMPICDEMQELLDQDNQGSALFHKLTDGKIRSLLYKANGYKSSDKRLEKSVIIIEHLKANNGALDWQMLNEAFKQGLNF